jgi:hypothetical protein
MRLVPLAVVSLALSALSAAGLISPGTTFAQSAAPDSAQMIEAGAPPPDSASGVQWFPNRWVMAALIAAPREIRLAGGLYGAERDLNYEPDGSTLESEVSIGYRIPVVRLLDGGAEGVELDLGFEVGIWSRFNMETDERDLIASDYRVGFPMSVRYRSLEGRLTLHHSSSHLGDDYIKRHGAWVYQVSREALELILAVRPIEPVRLYGGGDLNVGRGFDYGVDDDFYGKQFTTVEQWVLRFGAEYDPSWMKQGSVQPVLGANFETTDWTQRLATTVRGGVAFRINSIRILLDAQYRDGPSAMGQFRLDPDGFDDLDEEKPFRGVDEKLFGFGLEVQIGGLVALGPAGS